MHEREKKKERNIHWQNSSEIKYKGKQVKKKIIQRIEELTIIFVKQTTKDKNLSRIFNKSLVIFAIRSVINNVFFSSFLRGQ